MMFEKQMVALMAAVMVGMASAFSPQMPVSARSAAPLPLTQLYEPFGFIGKVSVVDPPATGGAQPDVHQYLGHACAREIHVRDIFKRFVSEKTTRIAWGSGSIPPSFVQARLNSVSSIAFI